MKILQDFKRAVLILALACAFAVAHLFLIGFTPPAGVPFGVEMEDIQKLPKPIVWVDARQNESFHADHVPGALNLNRTNWEQALPSLFERYKPGDTIIVYCSPECSESEEIALRIRSLGLDQAWVLEGGFEAWKNQNRGL